MADEKISGGPPEDEVVDLDPEHRSRIRRVERVDTKAGQDEVARDEDAEMVEGIQELNARRDGLGKDEHIDACRRCKWYPYRISLWRGSRWCMAIDSVFWMLLWAGLWWLWFRYYRLSDGPVPAWLYLFLVAVPALGILCAKAARVQGQQFAVNKLTDPHSVDDSVDHQVKFGGTAAIVAAILLLAILALLFFSPPSLAVWSMYLSGILGFGANVALGLASGVGGHAAELLMKPSERDDIDCRIAMKERTRKLLRKYFVKATAGAALSIVLFHGALASGHLQERAVQVGDKPDRVLVKAVDITDSVDPDQRDRGIAAMVDRAPEQARRLGAQTILVITFADELLFANMTWVPVPQRQPDEDCDSISPKFTVMKSAMMLSPAGLMEARAREVQACLARRENTESLLADQDRRMREQLRQAMRVTPRRDASTRIIAMLRQLLTRPYVRAVEVLTDGIDNSGAPLSGLVVPDGVRVTMILAKPNPNRRSPTLDDVLSRGEAWSAISGISVTTVSEYVGFSQFVEGR
jgi:hypothetical protein